MERVKKVDMKGGRTNYLFWCPGCKSTHTVNDTWTFNGDLEKPTFSPSVLVTGNNRRCHSFIGNGQIRYLRDCTHGLKNRTVDLPVINEYLNDDLTYTEKACSEWEG